MERIKQAVELAKASRKLLGEVASPQPSVRPVAAPERTRTGVNTGPTGARAVRLDEQHLKSMRIITQEAGNPQARGL